MWVSQEAASRSTDDWKDTTMIPEALTCTAVLGLDVGKAARWACCVTRPGEVVANRRAANAEKDLDELFSQMAAGTLVVVDQCRNIGALALARARAAARGADRARINEALSAALASTRPSEYRIKAENPQVMTLARRIREASEEASRIDGAIAGLLAEDGTYACLLTVPGIGPRTASELVVAIRIEDFPDHDHLASYCGIAPKNRRSGTSISSVRASRQGNKR